MMKNISVTTLLLLIAIVGAAQTACDAYKPTYYTTSETYIYQRAKTSSAIVTKVPRGEKINVIESDDYPNPNMWLICHKGKAGYALKKLLSYDRVELGQNESIDPDIPNQGELEARQPITDRVSDLFEDDGPNGNPNSDVLSGISTGAGTIGGGLENRGGAGPAIEDTSKEQGKVVIRICINSSGKVISADYTQRGSTTQSRTLIKLAKENAMQYAFNAGSVDKQCGTIAYYFRSDGPAESNEAFAEGLGSVTRARISSPPISDLMKKVGRVVVKVCINRRGAVIYAEYDSENSTLDDIGHKKRAVEHVQKIVFERNDDAPDKECGRLAFRMTPNGFEQE